MVEQQEAINPMIELDAKEFGIHVKQGGWRMGLLVARNVELGAGRNERGSRLRDRGDEKVSAERFAEEAGTSGDRVLRYYHAWERAATKGYVPAAADLAPGDEVDGEWETLEKEHPWSGFMGAAVLRDSTGGATGKLNLTIQLGHFGDRLLRSHKRLTTFFLKDVQEEKPGKDVRKLAGRYADCLETHAMLLRKVEAGEELPPRDELKDTLATSRYFPTA